MPCCSNPYLVVALIGILIIGMFFYIHKPHHDDILFYSNFDNLFQKSKNLVEGLKNQSKENEGEAKKTKSAREWSRSKKSSYIASADSFPDQYVQIYDNITFSNSKFNFETMIIMKYLKRSRMFASIKILDIGCTTGLHAKFFTNKGYEVIGVDKSKDVIEYCKSQYPENKKIFKVGDAQSSLLFKEDEFSHILCMNSTIYYMNDIKQFLKNCYHWLNDDGILFLHLVDDVEQRYYDTNGWVKIDPRLSYKSTYETEKQITTIHEKIKHTNGDVLIHQHRLYHVGKTEEILHTAKKLHFSILKKISLKKVGFEHHYVFVLQK
mgnify:CR=1 FL=1